MWGELYFKVNETCLHGDHNIFMVAPNDRDAHNPILVHLDPSDPYKPANMKMKYAEKRKERQKEKKKKAYEDQASTYQGNTGWGGSSSSSSRPWRSSDWR